MTLALQLHPRAALLILWPHSPRHCCWRRRSLLQRPIAQTRELTTTGELLDRVAAVVQRRRGAPERARRAGHRDQAATGRAARPSCRRRTSCVSRCSSDWCCRRSRCSGRPRANLKVPDETLNGALQDIAQRNNLPLSPACRRSLAQQGVDYASYRDAMRKELTLTLLRQRDVIQRISRHAARSRPVSREAEERPEQSAEYNVSHILIAVPQTATPEQLEAGRRARKTSTSALAKARTSASSPSRTRTARRRSKAAALGWRKGAELPTFLSEVVAKLKPGKVSEPLRTPTGYHIVRLNEVARRDRAVGGRADSRAAHPDEAQRAAGRRDREAETHGNPRAHRRQGRGFRGSRQDDFGRSGLRR